MSASTGLLTVPEDRQVHSLINIHAVEICLDNVTGVVRPNVEICMNLTVVKTLKSPAYAIEPFLINTAKTRTSPDCRLHIDSYLFFTPIYTNTLRAFLNHGLEPSLRLSSNPYLVIWHLEICFQRMVQNYIAILQ